VAGREQVGREQVGQEQVGQEQVGQVQVVAAALERGEVVLLVEVAPGAGLAGKLAANRGNGSRPRLCSAPVPAALGQWGALEESEEAQPVGSRLPKKMCGPCLDSSRNWGKRGRTRNRGWMYPRFNHD